MAAIERRGNRFRCIFHYQGRRFAGSLSTDDPKEADDIAGMVEQTLRHIRQGVLVAPDGADFLRFVLSGGRLSETRTLSTPKTLEELRDRYVTTYENGGMEENSLKTVRMHLGHIVDTLTPKFPIQTLCLGHLQQHVNRRAKGKGFFGRSLSPVTLRKEIASFRACWNWGVLDGIVVGRFPNKGLVYPKTEEKPDFRTYDEIRKLVDRGGLTTDEVKEQWDGLFLTLPEIDELLKIVRGSARHDVIYPMFAFAAHTGARRSEIFRTRIADVDFTSGTIVIREKKRKKGQRSSRRVPITALLEAALKEWIEHHPGGTHLFCLPSRLRFSKKERGIGEPFSRDEMEIHFRRAVSGTRWAVIRGWHTLRHSFITNCAAAGTDQRLIDDWVGHTSEEMRKRYRHLIPSHHRDALRSVFP